MNRFLQFDAKIKDRIARTIVRCHNKDCHRGYEIRELVYLQTHWYVEPTGHTGGNYWNEGEGKWECPVCGTITRLYDKPDIAALKPYFKSVKDTYDKK